MQPSLIENRKGRQGPTSRNQAAPKDDAVVDEAARHSRNREPARNIREEDLHLIGVGRGCCRKTGQNTEVAGIRDIGDELNVAPTEIRSTRKGCSRQEQGQRNAGDEGDIVPGCAHHKGGDRHHVEKHRRGDNGPKRIQGVV